jgi:hypothetical protein
MAIYPDKVPKPMGFGPGGVWVMGYCGLMGYGVQIPANQVGGPEMLWYFRVYGLSRVWVMGVSTVPGSLLFSANRSQCGRRDGIGAGDKKIVTHVLIKLGARPQEV